ncbi:MAG TPA: hypothetical protein VIK81_00515 [Patescibacteria group bacterium]
MNKERSQNYLPKKMPKQLWVFTVVAGVMLQSNSDATNSYQLGSIIQAPSVIDELRTDQAVNDEYLTNFDFELETENNQVPTKEPSIVKSGLDYDIETMNQILGTMKINGFTPTDIEDVELYYPIYDAISKKFEIEWYVIWIIHRSESNVSRNPNAFDRSTGYFGAGQRGLSYHFDDNVDFAATDLEFLSVLPQRDPTDWKELAWVAMKLSEDKKTAGSLAGAFYRYTPKDETTEKRIALFNYYCSIFP